MSDLSTDPVIVRMAQDVLDEFGAADGRVELASDGVDEAAAFTYMVRGGDVFSTDPDEILPAVLEAFDRLAESDAA